MSDPVTVKMFETDLDYVRGLLWGLRCACDGEGAAQVLEECLTVLPKTMRLAPHNGGDEIPTV